MFVQDSHSVTARQTPNGEIIRELGGNRAGGLQQHSIAHITLPPGKASRCHFHPTAEESYFVLAGVARVLVDGDERLVTVGQMVAIPSGVVHQIFNGGDEDLSFLAICAPPWTPECSVYLD